MRPLVELTYGGGAATFIIPIPRTRYFSAAHCLNGEVTAVQRFTREERDTFMRAHLPQAGLAYLRPTPDGAPISEYPLDSYRFDALAKRFVHPDYVTEKCPGEAHGNPHIDNCMICAPYWGFVFHRRDQEATAS